ncbi:16S rRNA (cytosine(1402)-N(4))-methyltransferase, partial [Francisella tularensis subsp. holarctica]
LPQDSSQINLKWITKKSKANEDELNQNVRSSSAILRVVEKL